MDSITLNDSLYGTICSSHIEFTNPLETYRPLARGERVRIKDGYEDAGMVGYYVGKSRDRSDEVCINIGSVYGPMILLAAAIEPYPYSREERIERAIEDYEALTDAMCGCSMYSGAKALLFAILDAGI